MTPRRIRRRRLAALTASCTLAIATVAHVAQPDDAGSSSPETFAEWYSHPENRAWYQFQRWYGASPRNAAYFHIRQHFGTGRLGDQAVRVALCESDLQPRAVSPTNDHGVFQLNAPSWRSRFGDVTGVAWADGVYHADLNARFARWLHDVTGGWSHWACRSAA